jgi:predicted transcriptional regulator of viral defense system
MSGKIEKIVDFIREKGGLAGYSEIIKAGFDKSYIRANIKAGKIIKKDSALYSLPGGNKLSNPDFTIISIKIPNGVICLLSALYFHEATVEIPRYIEVAIKKSAFSIKIKQPPVKFYRFSIGVWKAGIEEHEIDGRKVKIYSLAKTVADCFKFRNKVGADTARAALKIAVLEKGIKPLEIMKYAKICRVDSIIKPMLETMI